MKTLKSSILVACVLTLLAASTQGQGLTLNFANNTNTAIQFNGTSDSFGFSSSPTGPQTGYQWHISSETGGSSAVGLLGLITGGPFSYGPISSTGSGITLVQNATVTDPLGNLVINDGAGFNLTGLVSWETVTTYSTTLGVLNTSLAINLTSLAYVGSNPDLQYLVENGPGTLDLSFQFSPGQTLTTLSTGTGLYMTSYSGSLTVVPEPSVLSLAGLSGLGMLLLRHWKQHPKGT